MSEEQRGEVETGWLCPWCGRKAHLPARQVVICHSRACECGALGLGAYPWDTDEIIDDAINVFGIADGYLTPFDEDRMAGLRTVGVEIREGPGVPARDGRRPAIRVLWFRKGQGQAT